MVKVESKKLNWADINMAKVDLNKLVLHFCQCMKSEGKSSATTFWYTQMLGCFTNFLINGNVAPTLEEFNIETARDFVIYEQQRELSPYTIQARVRALKGFSSWLFSENYMAENTLALLKIPKAPIKLIEPLTTEEIDLLVSIQNPLTALGSRNLGILTTFL